MSGARRPGAVQRTPTRERPHALLKRYHVRPSSGTSYAVRSIISPENWPPVSRGTLLLPRPCPHSRSQPEQRRVSARRPSSSGRLKAARIASFDGPPPPGSSRRSRGHRQRPRRSSPGGRHLVNQADPERFGGIDELAGEDRAVAPCRVPTSARQPLRAAAAGDDPEVHLRLPELGGVAAIRMSHAMRQLHPAAQARNRSPPRSPAWGTLGRIEDGPSAHHARTGPGAPPSNSPDVRARDERLVARAGEDDRRAPRGRPASGRRRRCRRARMGPSSALRLSGRLIGHQGRAPLDVAERTSSIIHGVGQS